MADILIRGIEMPKNCMACSDPYEPFSMHRKCHVDGHVFCYSYVHGRDKDCPLVELPEHGDLIDRDALVKQMGVTDMDCYKCEFGNHGFCGRGEFSAACEAIEDAPVIVPANKVESE